MASTHRLFMLEPVTLSVKAAEAYGDIKYLFEKNAKRSSIWSVEFPDEVLDKLASNDFNPSDDLVVITGHMVPLMIMTAALVNRYGSFRALMYSATDRGYVIRQLGRTE